MRLLTQLRKELLAQWRSYRFLIVAAVLSAFGLLSPLIARFTPEMLRLIPGAEEFAGLVPPPTVLDAVGQYIKNTGQFGLLLGILVSMGLVAQEKSQGTAAMTLVKPLSRGIFLLSKFASLLVVFGVSILLAGAGGYYYTRLLFEPLPLPPWLALNALLLVHTMVYVSLTLFFSTLSRSQGVAAGLSLAALLVLALLGSLPSLGSVFPGQLMGWGAAVMTGTGEASWPALWISLGILLAAQVGAWIVFRKQEL